MILRLVRIWRLRAVVRLLRVTLAVAEWCEAQLPKRPSTG